MNTTTAQDIATAANVTVEQVEKFAQLLAATARDNASRGPLDVVAIAKRDEDTRLRNALARPADLTAIFGGTYDEFRAEAKAVTA
jgi:hypothetical protein